MSNDNNVELENDNGDIESSYQPPPQKTIEEIVAADQEDESLRKYKETLLGAAQSETIIVGKCFWSDRQQNCRLGHQRKCSLDTTSFSIR